MKSISLTVRLKGGLGNQMFQYAAGLTLAERVGARLVLDTVSGFKEDLVYKRKYALESMMLTNVAEIELITSPTHLGLKGTITRKLCRIIPIRYSGYIYEDGRDLKESFQKLVIQRDTILDGYWQSEHYFKGSERKILSSFRLGRMSDLYLKWHEQIKGSGSGNTVAIHIRLFDKKNLGSRSNITKGYIHRAMNIIRSQVENPKWFIFSDDIEISKAYMHGLADINDVRLVNMAESAGGCTDSYEMMLMSECSHRIISNSTFGWWSAWIGEKKEAGIVICPDIKKKNIGSWGANGQIPGRWLIV